MTTPDRPLRVAVIGARSFVGAALGRELVRQGHVALELTRDQFDVRDHQARLPEPIDSAVFLAQDRSYAALETPALGVFEVNTVGVLNAAIKARDAGARSFLFTSTGNVYQPSFKPHVENEPVRRSDIYSTSKVFGEQILDLIETDLVVCRPRLFGAYGPDQTIGLLAGLVNRIRSDQPVTLQPRVAGQPDGGFAASLTHVHDIASALVELIEVSMNETLPYAVNLAAPKPATLESVATNIAAALGRPVVLQPADGERGFDLIADTTLASSLLTSSFRSVDVGIGQALAD